jgi:hypothetical protein
MITVSARVEDITLMETTPPEDIVPMNNDPLLVDEADAG